MGVETILLAIGKGDENRVEEFVRPTVDIAAATGAKVVVGHVFEEDTYRRALDHLGGEDREEGSVSGYTGGEAFDAMSRGFGVVAARMLRDRPADDWDAESVDNVARRYNAIRRIGDALGDAGVRYEVRGRVGNPAREMLDMADDVGADFVVVGGRDRSRAAEALFGSVSREIVRSARCPVISVRRYEA